MSGPSHGRLVTLCLQCFTTLNPARVSVAAHVDEFISSTPELVGELAEGAATTLREMVYALVRYKKLLAVTTDGLYAACAAQIARSDRRLYELFVVLVVFKLPELGLAELRELVRSQEPHKMHALLSFLCDPDMQAGWLKEQWSTVYDHTYVEETLLANLRSVGPQLSALLSELTATIAHASTVASAGSGGLVAEGRPRKESTVPEPFALTQPKVRMLPAPPVQMDAVYKATPLPAPTPSLQDLELEAQNRRRVHEDAAARRLANSRAPRLSTDMRGAMTHLGSEKLRLELEERERLALVGMKPTPLPVVRDVAAPKGTVASILREDLLYKRRLEEQAAQLAQFESAMRDENDFHAWQLKMEAEDDAKQALEVLQRKEASRASADNAVRAMAKAAEEKHKAVLEIRSDLRVINDEKQRQADLEQQAKRELAIKITSEKANIALAAAEVLKTKTAQAEAIADAKAVAAIAAKKQRVVDLEAKKQLIRSIQAMEKLAAVRARRPKEIDPTTTGGLGLLDEMSLVELQARASHLAEREQALLGEKRAKILADKSAKAAVLEQMQRNAQRMRKDMKATFTIAKAERATQAAEVAQAALDRSAASAEVLKQHLSAAADAKRTEAMRLVSELRAKKLQNAFYAQAKASLHAEREEDLQRAAVRREATQEARDASESKDRQIEAYTQERNRLRVEKAKARETNAQRNRADATLQQHRADHLELEEEQTQLKTIQHSAMKQAYNKQVEVARNINPYAKTIAEREAKRAARLSAAAKRPPPTSSSAAAAAASDEHEFLASQAMAEAEVRAQIAALSIDAHAAAASDGEEEKTQSLAATPVARATPSAAASSNNSAQAAVAKSQAALANITLKRSSAATAAKPSSRVGSAASKTSARGTSSSTAARPQPLAARA